MILDRFAWELSMQPNTASIPHMAPPLSLPLSGYLYFRIYMLSEYDLCEREREEIGWNEMEVEAAESPAVRV